jgi:hypothetical protein
MLELLVSESPWILPSTSALPGQLKSLSHKHSLLRGTRGKCPFQIQENTICCLSSQLKSEGAEIITKKEMGL